jgi:hypothetical protein
VTFRIQIIDSLNIDRAIPILAFDVDEMGYAIDSSADLYINLSVAIGTLDPLSGLDIRLGIERFGHKRD